MLHLQRGKSKTIKELEISFFSGIFNDDENEFLLLGITLGVGPSGWGYSLYNSQV